VLKGSQDEINLEINWIKIIQLIKAIWQENYFIIETQASFISNAVLISICKFISVEYFLKS
jgi:hypothetical protein